MKQLQATVISNDRFSSERRKSGEKVLLGFNLLWLSCPEIENAKPGQFLMVNCGEDCCLNRPISIHQIETSKLALWVAVWENGKGTQWLAQRKPGDKIGVFGPLGNGYDVLPGTGKLLLLAGGLGIAPIYFLAQETKKSRPVTVVHGASSSINLYPKDMMPQGIENVIITDEEGLITDLIPDYIDQADQVFACGPLPMYRAMAVMPDFQGKNVQVSLEMRMACGVNACYGCTIKTKNGPRQVCHDGPVFEMDEVVWDSVRI